MSVSPLRFRLTMAALGLALSGAIAAQVPSVGLSTVRSQRFHNENLLGFYTPQEGDLFGAAVAVGDFNGDGAEDLATGLPDDDGLADSPIQNSGSVVVRFGIPGVGLASNLASTVLRQVPAWNPAETSDLFGASLAACDFNGDGRDDLAVGVPGEDHVGQLDAGAVQIHYGSSDLGINFNPEGFFTQSSPGIPGTADPGDMFGETLACGDFNGDGFGDLVVGSPNEDLPFWGDDVLFAAGMAVVIPGSAFGLDASLAFDLDQSVDGVDGDPEYPDAFSWGLAAGDFNADGFDDLAVGSPGEDYKGAIHIFFGSPSNLTTSGSLFWMETFLGGSSEDGDRFGLTLVTGDFDDDGFEDLALGIPGDDLGLNEQELDAGRIAVLYGGRLGFDRSRTRFWTEFDVLGPANSELDDRFGEAMAAGDFDKDGFVDLAIAHPGETLAGSESGEVTVLMGSVAGLVDFRTREIAAGVEGFPGTAGQPNQRFAYSLAAGDFDGDGHGDLAIGIPQDDVNGLADVGSEAVLYGALFADGVDTGDTSMWSQTVGSPTGNRVEATNAARLGPAKGSGRFGVAVVMPGSGRTVGTPAFVRVDANQGFNSERVLKGSFFIDPQSLAIAPTTDQNFFQFMAFQDSVGPTAKTRLAFDLLGTATSYALVASSFNEATSTLQVVQPAVLTAKGAPDGRNIKIDFEWRAGTAGAPGQLTVWRTFFSTGEPAASGKVQLFSVPLPNTTNAVINAIAVGMVSGQDPGTSGQLFLDEISFRR